MSGIIFIKTFLHLFSETSIHTAKISNKHLARHTYSFWAFNVPGWLKVGSIPWCLSSVLGWRLFDQSDLTIRVWNAELVLFGASILFCTRSDRFTPKILRSMPRWHTLIANFWRLVKDHVWALWRVARTLIIPHSCHNIVCMNKWLWTCI